MLVLVAGCVWGCDALEPRWLQAHVTVDSTVSCDDVCVEQYELLCLENVCGAGGTVGHADPTEPTELVAVPAACDEPILDVLGEPMSGMACCCATGV